jgi:hypothetical protein
MSINTPKERTEQNDTSTKRDQISIMVCRRNGPTCVQQVCHSLPLLPEPYIYKKLSHNITSVIFYYFTIAIKLSYFSD